MTDHRVSISDGAVLSVRILGAEPADKPLLIGLHGAPGLILVYDARGSGESDLKPPYTHERWIADIEELRIWAGAENIVMAGGSYGGALALGYALAYPSRVLALILRDTFSWGTALMMHALMISVTSKRVTVDPERQYRMWTGVLLDDADFEAGVAEMSSLFRPASLIDIEAHKDQENDPRQGKVHAATQNFAFSHNMPKFDVRARLEEITVPTLVIVGRQDVIIPVAFSEEIAREIPRAQLAIFENSGHNPAMDETLAFEKLVEEFVSSLVYGS